MDPNEKVAQNPTTPENEAPAEKPADTTESLLADLKSLGVNNPQDLQNMATASSQAGKMGNEIGRLRQQIEQQNQMIASLQNQPAPQQDPYDDGTQIDLGRVVEDRVQKVLTNYLDGQRKAEEAAYMEMEAVRSNPRYPAMAEMFEKHLQNPQTAMKLRSGQTTLKDEFNTLAFTYYDTLLGRVTETLSGTQKTATPPHVEQGDTHAPVTPTIDDERTETIKKTVKARQSGQISSDDALKNLVKTFLPADDDIWRR